MSAFLIVVGLIFVVGAIGTAVTGEMEPALLVGGLLCLGIGIGMALFGAGM